MSIIVLQGVTLLHLLEICLKGPLAGNFTLHCQWLLHVFSKILEWCAKNWHFRRQGGLK